MKCNNEVFVLSSRDAPDSRVIQFLQFAYGAHSTTVRAAIPFKSATVEELRKCDRVLMPHDRNIGYLLTQEQMQHNANAMMRYFDSEAFKTYGA